MEAYSLRSRDKVTACLSFYQALGAVAEAETTNTEVKENLVAEAEAEAELLLCTLTLKKLMIFIQAATYTYQLALVALAAKAGTDFRPEAPEKTLLRGLKIDLVRQCVQLHVSEEVAAPATLEMLQPMRLAATAELFLITLIATKTNAQKF